MCARIDMLQMNLVVACTSFDECCERNIFAKWDYISEELLIMREC